MVNIAVVVADVPFQSSQIAVLWLLLRGGYKNQLLFGTRNRHVDETVLVSKLRNYIIRRAEDDDILFPSLKFMDGINFNFRLPNLPFEKLDLIPVRGNNANL